MNLRMGQPIIYLKNGERSYGNVDSVGEKTAHVYNSLNEFDLVRFDQILEVFQREIHVVFWVEEGKPCSLATFDFQVADRLFDEVQDREPYVDMVTRTVNAWEKL